MCFGYTIKLYLAFNSTYTLVVSIWAPLRTVYCLSLSTLIPYQQNQISIDLYFVCIDLLVHKPISINVD